MSMPTLMVLTIDLAQAMGVSAIHKFERCWEVDLGGWRLAANGHREERADSRGCAVPPASVLFDHPDYLAIVVVGPSNGFASPPDAEQAVEAALRARIAELGGKCSDADGPALEAGGPVQGRML